MFVLLSVGLARMPATGFISRASAQAGAVSQGAQSLAQPISFADVVEKVKPAVISVRVKIDNRRNKDTGRTPESPLERFFRRFGEPDGNSRNRVLTGQGSGFFISTDGYAVTNYHVVEKADNVEVTTDAGHTFSAKVIGADARSDVALIKVEGASDVPFVKFADKPPRIGDWVIAVGNPFGLGGSVTAGIVSARGRDIGSGPYDDFIQIDAAVNRGNSGGPTFDVAGNVIGVNSAIISPSGGSVGIGFAIPADTVKSVVEQLREKGKVTRGWIGVEIQDVTPEIANDLGIRATRGALVAEPQTGGPAAKAGIESGDVITAINAKEIADSRDLAKTISAMPPGSSAKITALHAGQEKTFGIVLGSLPDAREAPESTIDVPKQHGTNVARLGLSVAPTAAGVVVTAIDPDGVAAEQGVTPGDVIVQAGGRRIASATDLRTVVEAAQKAGRHSVLMRVKSGDGTKFVTLPLARG
jgi:serine protease Do